jgi:predicted ATPase
MDIVWPKLVVEENNLQVQIVTLRKVLGHPAIANIPGRGYRFTLPVRVESSPDAASATHEATSSPGVLGTLRTNLPRSLPRLYGREHDLKELLELMERHDLVTVAGPGGIGKTRLAQAAAAACIAMEREGAWWVDLDSLTEAGLIANAVALALGVVSGASEPMAAVMKALSSQPSLLVLDNAEHLIDGVADFISRLRPAASGVRVLVTSQEVLHLAGEYVFRPEPLALPEGDDPERMASSGAVDLFVARAQAADRRFVLDAGNRAAVADICRRLDGIPLAIELAAARVPLLGIEGLRGRLDERFKVLTSGDRLSLRRHQTLRAALEWSHGLLTTAEQAVLRRLGVFAGGFTLEAAQHIVADEEAIDQWDVLDHLGALVDKSLVRAEGEVTPRYRVLETTRLFTLERLIESGEAATVRKRHLEHYLELAEEAIARMTIGNPLGLAFFDRERDNILLALAWAEGNANGSAGLRLAAATRYYWTSRGMPARGLEVMRAALLAAQAQQPSAARCHVLGAAAYLGSLMGAADDARHDIDQAMEEARIVGDERCLCIMLSAAGFVRLRAGDVGQARALAHEAMTLGRLIGDSHELGNAITLSAAVHGRAGEPDLARHAQEEAVALRQRIHHPWSEAVGRLNLAQMSVDADMPQHALPHLLRVLELLPQIDSQQIGIYLLDATAGWCAGIGQHEAAILLDATARTQYRRVGLSEHSDAKQSRRFELSRSQLDPVTCERAKLVGETLSYTEALRRLRELLDDETANISSA